MLTAVWKNGGFSAKINGSSTIELLCENEHLRSDFRHFAGLNNGKESPDSLKLKRETIQ